MEKPSGRVKDYTGKTLGGWIVISFAGVKNKTHATWVCRCSVCGCKRVWYSGYLWMMSQYKKGETHSCRRCSYIRQTGKSNLKPYESLYNWLVKQAKRTGRVCTITYSQFLKFTETKRCHYCGDIISWAEFNINKNGSAYYLDRKDSGIGYTKENCLVCCSMCNAMKRDFSYKVFITKLRQICRRTPWRH